MPRTFYLLSVWIHVVAAALWIGGMLFLTFVLVPSLRKLGDRRLAAELVRATGRRYRLVGWVSIGVLVLSGFTNLAGRGISHSALFSAELWDGWFGRLLAWKIGLVLVVIGLSAAHDLEFGRRADAPGGAADPAEAERLRRLASAFGRVVLVLSLVIAGLGVLMVRGLP
jgi:uncharacterized membrane protein